MYSLGLGDAREAEAADAEVEEVMKGVKGAPCVVASSFGREWSR